MAIKDMLREAAAPVAISESTLWWARQGSNLRPKDYESPALTTELRAPGESRTFNPVALRGWDSNPEP